MFVSIEEEVVNDDVWSCMVVMLTEAFVEYEPDVYSFKTYNGNRPVIEVITPKDAEIALTEYKKQLAKKSQRAGSKRETRASRLSNKTEYSFRKSKRKSSVASERKLNGKSSEKSVRKSERKSGSKKEKKLSSKSDEESSSKDEAKSNRNRKSKKNKSFLFDKASSGGDKFDAKTRIALGIKQYILNIKEKELNQNGIAEENKTTTNKEVPLETKKKKKNKGKKERTSELKIHDEPRCGPSKYFVLIGFYDNTLITKLIKLNVPLLGIICYGEENLENITEKNELLQDNTIKTFKLYQFWLELFEIMKNAPFSIELNDFTIMTCYQPNILKSTEVELKPNEKAKIIYNYLTRVLYELAKTYRKYIHYINTSSEINSPFSEKLLANEFIYYNQMMDSVPLEYITVEYMVHCLVEHVVISEEEMSTETDIISYETLSTKDDHSSEPFIINHQNKIKKSTFNITPDICEISLNLYSHMPYCKLFKYLNSDIFQSTKVKFQLQFLMKCLSENSSKEKFELLIHQILFTQMYYTIPFSGEEVDLDEKKEQLDYSILNMINITSFDEALNKERTATITDKQSLIFEDINPEIERENDLLKLKSFLNCEEIINLKHFFVEDNAFLRYMIVEDLKKCELIQSLQRAINKYTNMYFLPSIGTNSLLAYFHNDFNKFGLYSNFIEGSLRTPVGFRDYFLHVRHDINDWLRSQKEIIDLANSIRKNAVHVLRENYNVAEVVPYPFPNKQVGSDVTYCGNSGYNLYNISDYYVSTKEKCTTFYSTEGVILSIKQLEWANLYTYLLFILKSFSATITYHFILNDSGNLFSEQDLHFNISLKNGIIITCIQKLVQENSDPIKSNEVRENKTLSGIFTKESPYTEEIINEEYNFDITLPTGLKIEVRYDRDYIKQYYLEGSNIPKEIEHEEYRNYIRNGTVIIFYKNDIIHILYSNGSRVEINRVIKRNIITEEKLHEVDAVKTYKLPIKSRQKLKKIASEKEIVKVEEVKTIEIQTDYSPIEIQIFGWTGESVNIAFDIISDFTYLHKMRVAQDKKQAIIKKTDGTSSLFTDKGTLSVMYPNGTLIKSEISYSDITFISPDEEESDDQSVQDDLDKKVLDDFRKTLKNYIIPAYMKLHEGITMERIKIIKKFFLTNFAKLKFTKNESTDEEDTNLETDSQSVSKDSLNEIILEESKNVINNENYEGNDDNDLKDSLFENLNVKYFVHHPLFANIRYKGNEENWIIDLPDDTCIIVGKKNSSIITHNSSILIRKREVNIFSNKPQIDKRMTLSSLNLNNNFTESTDIWITEDSLGRTFVVNSEGKMRFFVKDKNEPSTFSPMQTRLYNRFYVIKSDLTGYEFIHFRDNKNTLRKFNKITEKKSEQKVHSCSDMYSINSFNIFQNKTELFKMKIVNPIKNSNITKQDLGDYFPQPKKWIFDSPILKNTEEKIIIEPISRPLAIIYRKVKNVTNNYQSYYKKLLKALTRMDKIKEYFYEAYENNTIYCKYRKSRESLAREYKKIIGYIGSVNSSAENKD